MYEAVKSRAPISSKAAGVMTMILVTTAAGYVMANGFGARMAELIRPTTTTVVTLPPEAKPLDEPPPFFDTIIDLPAPPVPPIPLDTYTPPDKAPPITISDPPVMTGSPGAGRPTPPPAPVKKLPVLIAKDKPPYPAIAIRHEWVGASELTACVDAKGRVTSASIARASGHDVLDEAALKWVRNAKFSPGTLDGAAQPMCGANVIYEWRLDR